LQAGDGRVSSMPIRQDKWNARFGASFHKVGSMPGRQFTP
jgi:hypothetical protein